MGFCSGDSGGPILKNHQISFPVSSYTIVGVLSGSEPKVNTPKGVLNYMRNKSNCSCGYADSMIYTSSVWAHRHWNQQVKLGFLGFDQGLYALFYVKP